MLRDATALICTHALVLAERHGSAKLGPTALSLGVENGHIIVVALREVQGIKLDRTRLRAVLATKI